MSVPNSFATATTAIPLANLDANFQYYDNAFQIAGTVMEVNYTFRLEDPTDNTKKAQFVMSGITTATTRQYTMPNSDGTFALLGLAQTWSATQTFGAVVLNGTVTSGNIAYTLSGTTSNLSLNAGQTTGTIVVGGTAGTGAITVGQSTAAQTLNFGTGATAAATTKTINFGTAGVSTSVTNINIGSAVTGATGTTTLSSSSIVLNGAVTSGNIAYTLSGTTSNLSLNAGQTTGTIVVGGTAGTGAITFGQSTAAQILNLATGATATATTKTVNIGTAGVSGSITNINIGSAVAGAVGTISINEQFVIAQPTPASISTTATLTNANIQTGIINTTGTSYTVTMPLGTTLETLVAWVSVDMGYDFTVINTASGTITIAVNTGVTSLGGLTIATGVSAQFRIRRTAANTFIMYCLS